MGAITNNNAVPSFNPSSILFASQLETLGKSSTKLLNGLINAMGEYYKLNTDNGNATITTDGTSEDQMKGYMKSALDAVLYRKDSNGTASISITPGTSIDLNYNSNSGLVLTSTSAKLSLGSNVYVEANNSDGIKLNNGSNSLIVSSTACSATIGGKKILYCNDTSVTHIEYNSTTKTLYIS